MTINISDIQLFTLLKAKIGEKEATAVIDYVKQETGNLVIQTKEVLVKDILSLQLHLDQKFYVIDEKFKSQEQWTANKISDSKNEMLKAMFITRFLQILSIIGGILAIAKFMK